VLVTVLLLVPLLAVGGTKAVVDRVNAGTDQATQNRIVESWEYILQACDGPGATGASPRVDAALGRLLDVYERHPEARAAMADSDGDEPVRDFVQSVASYERGDPRCAGVRERAGQALRANGD
jgi:hypothetical protein